MSTPDRLSLVPARQSAGACGAGGWAHPGGKPVRRRSTAHRADMDAKVADLTHESVPWNPYAPMKHFNAEKPVIAPWWRESPKEAYSTGIADPCSVIKNCKDSKSAKCARRRAPGVYSDWSLQERPGSSVADDAGTLTEVPNPAPLRATLQQRRRPGQQLSRRIPGSNGHRAAKAKLTRLDRRAVHLRREAHHELTSQLAGTHSEVVIEDLDLAAMNKSMGRRSFRRSVSDAALGAIRSQLTYQMTWRGTSSPAPPRASWSTGTSMQHRTSATGRILPVVARLEPRPRSPAVPPVAVGDSAPTSEYPVPEEGT